MHLLRSNLFRCPTCLVDVDADAVRVEDWQGNESTTSMRRRRFGRQPRETIEELSRGRRFTCKRGHTLPADLFELGVMPVALLGLSQSMKTHYVAALCWQLTREARLANLPHDRTLTFYTMEESRERLDNEYLDPLFGRKQVLVPTTPVLDPTSDEPVRDPVTLRTIFQSTRFVAPPVKKTYVSLYDAPGEMFRTQRTQTVHAPYLVQPSGIMLFVDVASIPGVREKLGREAPSHYSMIDPTVIASAADAMNRFQPTRVEGSVPVSVIVSRADLLVDSPAFERYQRALGQDPLQAADEERLAREFVSIYAPAVPFAIEDCFGDRANYFFASATGCSPVGDVFPTLSPWGCLGPLLYILEASGFAR